MTPNEQEMAAGLKSEGMSDSWTTRYMNTLARIRTERAHFAEEVQRLTEALDRIAHWENAQPAIREVARDALGLHGFSLPRQAFRPGQLGATIIPFLIERHALHARVQELEAGIERLRAVERMAYQGKVSGTKHREETDRLYALLANREKGEGK